MKTQLLTVAVSLLMVSAYAQSTIPYYENFENGSQWTASNTSGSLWTIGSPNISSAHSGFNVAGVGIGTPYLDNTNTSLYSPYFNFTNSINNYLSFWTLYETETNWDGTRLEYTLDGVVWNLLGLTGGVPPNPIGTTNWYSATLNSSSQPGWCGQTMQWKHCQYPLDSVPGISNSPLVRFRFIFTSDVSVNLTGFYIDDIYIGDGSGDFIGAAQTYSSPCGVPQNVNFSLWGFTDSSTIPVTVQVFFGDGTDTTFNATTSGAYSFHFPHTYNLGGNFSIQYIVSDSIGNADTLTQLNQVLISTNCGNISGKAFNDNNSDCIYNSGDSVLVNFPVDLELANGQFFRTFTDTAGDYTFQGTIGNNYTIRIGNYSLLGYLSVCPATGAHSVSSLPSTNNNFALYCAPGFDLQAHLFSWGFVPGQVSHLYAGVNNASCQVLNGAATIVLSPLLTFVSASIVPSQINGDTLTWSLNNLISQGNFNVTVNVLVDTTVSIGDTICNMFSASPVMGDSVPSNNYVESCRRAATSFDPNEKTVSPDGNILPETELTYTVFFQNTGNATAYNIHVVDTLDANLDLNTLHLLESSHTMQAQVLPGNILHFAFNNIQLPDSNANEPSSHGHVSYAIKPLVGLNNGTIIENSAGIIFDYNEAVITNTTHNVIDLGVLGINIHDFESGISIYPNPAHQAFTVNSKKYAEEVELKISDIFGRLIQTYTFNNEIEIDTKNWSNGIYFIQMRFEKEEVVKKLIIH